MLILPITIGCFCQILLLMTYMYFVTFFLILVDAVVIVFVYSQIYIVIRQYDNLRRHMVNAEMALDTTANNRMSGAPPKDDPSGSNQNKSSDSGNKRGSSGAASASRNPPVACSANVPYGCMRLQPLPVYKTSLLSAGVNDTTNKVSTRVSSITARRNSAAVPAEKLRLNERCDEIKVDNPEPKRSQGIMLSSPVDGMRLMEQVRNDKPEDKSKKVIQIKKNIKRETKTTRVCIIVSLIFIICCLPSAIFQVIWQVMEADYFSPNSMFFPLLKLFYNLSTFNAIANPIIYSISSNRFQQDIKRIFSTIPTAAAKLFRRIPCMR